MSAKLRLLITILRSPCVVPCAHGSEKAREYKPVNGGKEYLRFTVTPSLYGKLFDTIHAVKPALYRVHMAQCLSSDGIELNFPCADTTASMHGRQRPERETEESESG